MLSQALWELVFWESDYSIIHNHFPPKILDRTLTTYSTLCWFLVPTILPEPRCESATENRKTTLAVQEQHGLLYSHKQRSN